MNTSKAKVNYPYVLNDFSIGMLVAPRHAQIVYNRSIDKEIVINPNRDPFLKILSFEKNMVVVNVLSFNRYHEHDMILIHYKYIKPA